MTVEIIPFHAGHAAAWERLNLAWLEEGGFVVEAKDRQVLADPQGSFLTRAAASSWPSGTGR